MLSADQLRERGSRSPKIHLLKVESWGGETVALQELDGLQILEWDMACGERGENPAVALTKGTGAEHLVALSVVTCDLDADGQPVRGTGKRVFSSKPDDIATIRNWGSALQELYGVALKINRMLRRFDEDTEKNLLTAPSSGSGST